MTIRLRLTDTLIVVGMLLLLLQGVDLVYAPFTRVGVIGILGTLLLVLGLAPRLRPVAGRLADRMGTMALQHEQSLKAARIIVLVCGITALLASPVVLLWTSIGHAPRDVAPSGAIVFHPANRDVATGMHRAWAFLIGGWLLGEIALFRWHGRRGVLIAARAAMYLYVGLGVLILTFGYVLSLCGP